MISSIQFLRAIAAYLVVLVHIDVLLSAAGVPEFVSFIGNSGVDIFFVVSGFIMMLTTAQRESEPVSFILHRIARVAPLYWLITLIVFALASIEPGLFQGTKAGLNQLALSLLFIPYVREDGTLAPLVFVGWTLNLEMFFYALFAISLLLRSRRAQLFVLLAVLVGLVSVGPLFPSLPIPVQFYADNLLLEFAGGCVLGYLFSRLPNRAELRWPAIAGGLLCGAVIVASGTWPRDWPRFLVWGAPAFCLVYCALIYERAGGRTAGWLVALGNASYSIYLTHFFVTQLAIKVAGKIGVVGAAGNLFAAALVLIAVAPVGLATHQWIEVPLTRAARQWLGLARQNPNAVGTSLT